MRLSLRNAGYFVQSAFLPVCVRADFAAFVNSRDVTSTHTHTRTHPTTARVPQQPAALARGAADALQRQAAGPMLRFRLGAPARGVLLRIRQLRGNAAAARRRLPAKVRSVAGGCRGDLK